MSCPCPYPIPLIQDFSREDPSVLVESVDSATSAVTSMKAGLRCDDVGSVVDILKEWSNERERLPDCCFAYLLNIGYKKKYDVIKL